MEITGKLLEIREVKTFDSGFMVQEFVLDISRYNQLTGEVYENFALLQSANEKIDFTGFKIGDAVKVSFGINGRKYEKEGNVNYFQNLSAYKMELFVKGKKEEATKVEEVYEEKEDDLPY